MRPRLTALLPVSRRVLAYELKQSQARELALQALFDASISDHADTQQRNLELRECLDSRRNIIEALALYARDMRDMADDALALAGFMTTLSDIRKLPMRRKQ